MPARGGDDAVCRDTPARGGAAAVGAGEPARAQHLHPPPAQQDGGRAFGDDSPALGQAVARQPTAPGTAHLPTAMAAALAEGAPPRGLAAPATPLDTGCTAPHLCKLSFEPFPLLRRAATGDGAPGQRPAAYALCERGARQENREVLEAMR